jgi:GntR family transcriptional regulator, transcriptional repressor for pyruvate dehydrogenase complex
MLTGNMRQSEYERGNSVQSQLGGQQEMSLSPIPRANLGEQVTKHIRDAISSGEWKPGDKLPTEAELGKIFRVSRSTIREALRSLSFIGQVQMRPGQGTYVANGPLRFTEQLLGDGVLKTEKDFQDLVEARLALETELAALCARRATADEMQQLGKIISEMKRTVHETGKEFLELDVEFHFAIANFSKSKVLAQLLGAIRGMLQEEISKSSHLPGDRALAHAGHLKIFQAMARRNSPKAREAMREHLESFLAQAVSDGRTNRLHEESPKRLGNRQQT